jgi:seryl-tRNA synthetase
MGKYLTVFLILMLHSCESELTKLKNEREELQIKLNKLQKKQQEYGVRFNYEIIEFQKQREPILRRAEEINKRINELEK